MELDIVLEHLSKVPANSDAIITTSTEVKMNKKDVATKTIPNPYLGAIAVKTSKIKVVPDYEKEVNEARVAEGKSETFESQERKWGQNVGYGIVVKEDVGYMNYVHDSSVFTEYFFDGKPISYEELEPFIPKQKPYDLNQGLAQKVAYRTVKLANIVTLEVL